MGLFRKKATAPITENRYVRLELTDVFLLSPSPLEPEDVEDLIQSIRLCGVIQPIIVRPTRTGYELVSGERRYLAAKFSGMEYIDAMVINADDAQCQMMMLAEKLANRPLHYLEQSMIVKKALREGLTPGLIAQAIGRSEKEMNDIMQYHAFSNRMIQMLFDNDIPEEQAQYLLTLESDRARAQEIKEIVAQREGQQLLGARGRISGKIDGRILTRPIMDALSKLDLSGVQYELDTQEDEETVSIKIVIQKQI